MAPLRQTDSCWPRAWARLTIPMAVRPWCEPRSRLRASAFPKPIFQRRRNPAISFAASLATGARQSSVKKVGEANPNISPELDASLCGDHEDRTSVHVLPRCARPRWRHSTRVGGGNRTRTVVTDERKPVLLRASAIGIRRAMVRARKPTRPTKPSQESSLWRGPGRVPPSPRCQCQARPWQLQPRTSSRQRQR